MEKRKLKFVVQKHDATNLHYDFRLEIDRVLKSWAIPKKPLIKIGEKRLAILTENHPMSYANFEGVIPEGNYGAGKVEIWDRGFYENVSDDSAGKCFERGKIEIKMSGKKLRGNFVLIRMKPNEKFPKKDNWLFMKMK